MPPKAKFTKTEIIQAALEIVRSDGLNALTARALGQKLGSSARPIFTIFSSMDEVCREVVAATKRLYAGYVEQGLIQKEIPAFKGVGMQYIRFALSEPKLFQVLFMSEQSKKPAVEEILPEIEEHYQQIIDSLQSSYILSRQDAKWLYRHLWIYSHGIAVLCATNMCTFTPEEIGTMLTEVFVAMLKEMKGKEHD